MRRLLVVTFAVMAVAITARSGVLRAQAGATKPAPAIDRTVPPPFMQDGQTLEVPPPPFSDGIFPCSACHESIKPDRTRRVLTFHDDIVLKHDQDHRWCLDCHDADNRDFLHLAGGQRLPFDESYMLCGQCHGEKLRDWRVGVHGRRTGQWNGHKTYLLCVNCHNPHQPRFKPLPPKPAPKPPMRPIR